MNLWNCQLTQNSNWKIRRISALASKKRSIKKVKALSTFIFKKKIEIKVIILFLFDLVLEARAEILQIFQLMFWRIYDFINSFWLNLTFRNHPFHKLVSGFIGPCTAIPQVTSRKEHFWLASVWPWLTQFNVSAYFSRNFKVWIQFQNVFCPIVWMVV